MCHIVVGYVIHHNELRSDSYLSFPLVGNLSWKKDAGQAGMTKIQAKNLK